MRVTSAGIAHEFIATHTVVAGMESLNAATVSVDRLSGSIIINRGALAGIVWMALVGVI